jgi:hypothetical protein
MANRKINGSLFCLRTNRARNPMAICTRIQTRVDGPLRSGNENMPLWHQFLAKGDTRQTWKNMLKEHRDFNSGVEKDLKHG